MHKTVYIRVFPVMLALLALAVLPVCADVVVLQNGESLSGAFSRVRNNTLVFRTSMQGQLMTPMSEVRTLSADKMLCITMTDGEVYYGRLGVEEDKQQIFLLNGEDSVPVDVAAIQETLPIPTPPAGVDTGAAGELQVELGAGAQWRSDNGVGIEPMMRLNAQKRDETWRFDAEFLAERADPDSFPAYLRGRAEIVGNGNEKTSPFISIETDRDMDRRVALRQHLALGLYHTLYDTSPSSLDMLAALDLQYERERTPGQDLEREQGDLNARIGLRYYQLFASGHSLQTALTVLPALTNDNRLAAQAETIYSMPVTDRLYLRLELMVGYDSDPLTSDINHWNTTVGAGVNVVF